jgi:hypothetical protein
MQQIPKSKIHEHQKTIKIASKQVRDDMYGSFLNRGVHHDLINIGRSRNKFGMTHLSI